MKAGVIAAEFCQLMAPMFMSSSRPTFSASHFPAASHSSFPAIAARAAASSRATSSIATVVPDLSSDAYCLAMASAVLPLS